jgi:hypothetical protein
MVIVAIIVGVFVVLLAIAAVFDRRSRKIRGRVGRVRGGELGRKAESMAGLELSRFDAGQGMVERTRPEKQAD